MALTRVSGNLLTSTAVTAGIYGGSGNTVNIIVDAQGRITSAANVASVATTPAGTTNQIQFNNAGAFGANPSFSFDGTSFTLDGSTKVQVFGSGSKIQMQTPTASANWYFETAGTNLTASSAQSGQFNIQNATAVTTFGVGGATPSASGSGITFPASQSASSDANTLDDYEEGTWTPTLRGDSTAGTYTLGNLIGYYTKIGNQVTCWASFTLSAATGGSGYAQFGGLPFSYKAGSAITGTIQLGTVNIGTYNYITLMRDSGSAATTMTAQTSTNNAGASNSPISGYSTSSFVSYCITYTVS